MQDCLKCKKRLITSDERNKQLLLKVEEYKKEKASRKVKKNHWDNWKKTKDII